MGYTKDDELAINTIRLLAVSTTPLCLSELPHYSFEALQFPYPLPSSQNFLHSFIILLGPETDNVLLSQVDATFKANSGHPGAPMGMAPVAHVMFNKFMSFNPKNPDWLNRDRFVLS